MSRQQALDEAVRRCLPNFFVRERLRFAQHGPGKPMTYRPPAVDLMAIRGQFRRLMSAAG